MGVITIGRALRKKSAGDARKVLEKTYPKAPKKDIDDAIERYYGADEGADKLNGKTSDKDGDIDGDKPKTKNASK